MLIIYKYMIWMYLCLPCQRPLSVRDVVGWSEFIEVALRAGLAPEVAVMHGCDAVLLGAGGSLSIGGRICAFGPGMQ